MFRYHIIEVYSAMPESIWKLSFNKKPNLIWLQLDTQKTIRMWIWVSKKPIKNT